MSVDKDKSDDDMLTGDKDGEAIEPNEENDAVNAENSADENDEEQEPEVLTGHGLGGVTSSDLDEICGTVSGEDNLRSIMSDYFIQYASYVIRDRAIPDVDDGLKPVQRRILHVLDRVNDGRMHKVNTVVGDTMKYHPHGDMSIKDALVVLAEKGFFLDTQGNFGNVLTGDVAAAGRYIECRLSKLALDVLFSKEVTQYVPSYTGRDLEPVCLPSKVPTLLMMGSSGIAVGMASRIFSHNFCELLEAQIAILENRPFQILPDFIQGGLMDASDYQDGAGSILLRARIEADGDKKVVIREIPAGTTTQTIINSIKDMARKGKLKIAAINDYTAAEVDIEIDLQRNVYADEVIKELYAYTQCQIRLKSNLQVIQDNEPVLLTVSQVLRRNTQRLVEILQAELQVAMRANEAKFHAKTLERIFVENRIYKRIEECESLAEVKQEVRTGLEKFRELLHQDITDEDIDRLLQIPIRRISRFDFDRNMDEINATIKEIKKIRHNLRHIVEYTIDFLRGLLAKYGSQYPRRTEITSFSSINARDIARKNIKVCLDRVNGFLGTSIKSSNKSEEPVVCTEYDKLLVIRPDGGCKVIGVTEKEYVGAVKYWDILNKDKTISLIYRDKKQGTWYAKRFQMGQYIAGKEYHVVPEGCVIERIYDRNGIVLQLNLAKNSRRSYNEVNVNFDEIQLRAREARGFKLTSYPVEEIVLIARGTDQKPEAAAENKSDIDMAEVEEKATPEVIAINIPQIDIPDYFGEDEEGNEKKAEDKVRVVEKVEVGVEEKKAEEKKAKPVKGKTSKQKSVPEENPVAKDESKPKAKPALKIPPKHVVDEDSPFFLE